MDPSTDTPRLYAADVSPLEDEALYAAAYGLVSACRREKADRFRFEKDRRLCLGAELLLRQGLREAGLAADTGPICIGKHGKPFFPDGRISFSLSHSGRWALCALGGFELGCDLEEIRPVLLRTGSHFHPQEYADILSQPSETERQQLFYRYWTLKESFMKATGLGMALPLDGFRICRDGEITVYQTADDRTYSFREFSAIPGCCCAVCGAGDCGGAQLRIVDITESINGGR